MPRLLLALACFAGCATSVDEGYDVTLSGDSKSDVMNIVKTAAGYPGGLEETLKVLQYFDGESAAWRRVEKVRAEKLPALRIEGDAP